MGSWYLKTRCKAWTVKFLEIEGLRTNWSCALGEASKTKGPLDVSERSPVSDHSLGSEGIHTSQELLTDWGFVT
jgi:hypothetical protein